MPKHLTIANITEEQVAELIGGGQITLHSHAGGGGGGLTATIEFQDNDRRDHTVVIENGLIQSWTIA